MKVLCNINGQPVLPLCIFEDKEAAISWVENMLAGNNWFTESCGVTELLHSQETKETNKLRFKGNTENREFLLRSIIDFIKH